jgi:hypothetical protein
MILALSPVRYAARFCRHRQDLAEALAEGAAPTYQPTQRF